MGFTDNLGLFEVPCGKTSAIQALAAQVPDATQDVAMMDTFLATAVQGIAR